MSKIENDLVRKKKNENFIRAFEYVSKCLNMNQSELAKAIGSKTSYISVYRNGVRPVPEETIDELIRVSATIPDGQIYDPYLHGLSDFMLLRNVPDEEILAVMERKNNPDYEIMQQKKAAEPKNDPTANIIDLYSTLIKDVESIRRELSAELTEVRILRSELSTTLHMLRGQYYPTQQPPKLASESTANFTTKK